MPRSIARVQLQPQKEVFLKFWRSDRDTWSAAQEERVRAPRWEPD